MFTIIVSVQWYLGKRAIRCINNSGFSARKKPLLKVLIVSSIIFLNLPLFYTFAVGRPHEPLSPFIMYPVVYPYAIWGSSYVLIFLILKISDLFSFIYKIFIPLQDKKQHKTEYRVRRPDATQDSDRSSDLPSSIGKRNFLKIAGKGIIVAPVLCSSYGVFLARENFTVKDAEIKVHGLPDSLKTMRIVQISDIHAGLFMGKKEIREWVKKVAEIKPDMLFITGDFIASPNDSISECLDAVKFLSSFMPVYGCLGNHDYWGNEEVLTKSFKNSGARLLRNEGEGFIFNNTELNICGVEDPMRSTPDFEKASKNLNTGKATILLSHNPNYFDKIKKYDIPLTLSGHTHGGQINIILPGINISPARLITRYTRGLYTENRCNLYVNPGLGTIGFPLRLNVPPEITVIRLV
ncbi:MAG: hypothetical protein A3C43_06890 [Candidatus Schekmanbacteria bacterium RIFCSPHIGHO2_02_FULL_38_11]|uniref:Calcineurin-like phosphoesterase domain-containing protein n=1 Tax=Candidatus Schekmanbacteria bacterium RIFCSPLOWO2_12_FULL_38_15 TaxID=1817883 RepID=A0A1F7SGY0_9BACT|nr:MAG: hypothetical protein A2043_06015 [Candidatus Schekmanbacteria bacterium GWA2_38_9]OGL51653.1 MAG: hypothetical protein A3H37_12385 [Candidatus Schekmanbacteria bacterium RIFCSPLOWO2_02_FULL_38_14]OGL52508.1 MAG: hypothetical protein A3G31_11015 [Candidatus Schekmanbacteria bacterium RIFCSPLOWO2_12_FULL_38_15]OGL55553.1 MAG: hypothetical protein A3C43_06890 [Candidatus Schekmanbacteria bacterium RIFCSPHIGHO2_02_FULL_38_11]